MKIKVAVNGKSHKSISMQPYEVEFAEFAKSMSICKSGGKFESYFIRGGEMLMTPGDTSHKNPECWKDHYHRNDASLQSASLLILDADSSIDDKKSAPPPAETHEILKELGYTHFIYTTHSHMGILENNRYRVVLPCEISEKSVLIPTVEKIMEELRSAGSKLGDVKEARAWSQPWFFPTRDDASDGKFEYYSYLEGKPYTATTSEKKKLNNKQKINKENKAARDQGGGSQVEEEYRIKNRNVGEIINTIIKGDEGLHFALKDFIWGMIKDGSQKATVVATAQGLMRGSPLYHTHDDRYLQRYDEIERLTDGAIHRLKSEKKEHKLSSAEERKDALAKRLNEKGHSGARSAMPKYPYDCMSDWPEPWDKIWLNWKRFPNKLSEPLLVPTILGFHGFFLNSKYLNARYRRPNLYQLALAESTAYKDTNSKDVLRAISRMFYAEGTLGTVFDQLTGGDSNVTSDTALLSTLDKNAGKFFWCNTEATRVFQMLSSGGNVNSNVMALSDKMIEVVDGHEITGKSKAKETVQSIHDPNVQILFYAQPETIEKHINESMVDSGFLGRAIITLDVDGIANPANWDYDMFEEPSEDYCTMDDDLKMFYVANPCGPDIGEKYVCKLEGRNLSKAKYWQENTINPLVVNGAKSIAFIKESSDNIKLKIADKKSKDHIHLDKNNPDFKEKNLIGKMIRRMGNATEQLYSIVLGVCREWDKLHGKEPRSEIDINTLMPLLTFWAESKIYVIKEYVLDDTDLVAMILEEMMIKFIEGHIKIDSKYDEYIKDGMIPRGTLINKCRHNALLRDMGGNVNPTLRLSQTLDSLVRNEILDAAEINVNGSRKVTTFIYFR